MSPDGPRPSGVPKVKSLNCPKCGAPLAIRSLGQAAAVVCSHCHSILDAQDPGLKILQTFKAAVDEDPPLIPLGSRGAIRGAAYDVVGFQRRTIHVEGIGYSWHEYVLFNPYKGFRYLTEYNGHWNDTSILRSLPIENSDGSPLTVTYLGETYKHFQTAQAGTNFVLGEFPWQVHVGESAEVSDFISPPRVISRERTGKEITWSMGEYISGKDIWKAFGLAGDPPERIGVYENQPYPLSAATTGLWVACGFLLLLLLAVLVGCSMFMRHDEVIQGSYLFNTSSPSEASFVTDPFTLKGRTSNVELTTTAYVDNNWIYLNYALINQDTGQAYDVGREVSYYHGYDQDGAWSEGSQTDTVVLPSVPPGNYYFRVEPESDPGHGAITYSIAARRDVLQLNFFGIALLALLVPPALITWRSVNFEHLRWAESDYAPPDSNSDDDNDKGTDGPDSGSMLNNLSDGR
jgi:hypothetical protein